MRAFPFFPLSEPGAHTCFGADVGFGCWHSFPVWVVIRRPVFFLFTLEACGAVSSLQWWGCWWRYLLVVLVKVSFVIPWGISFMAEHFNGGIAVL